MKHESVSKAEWPFRLPPGTLRERVSEVKAQVDALGSAAQYGWGHTIDFGPFVKEGVLDDAYLRIAGALDQWAWWPEDLTDRCVADIGCYTGGLSLYLANRNPKRLYAVDEIPEHLQQCAYLARVFEQGCVATIRSSVFTLGEHIPENSLHLVLLSGVLYHLSDMLVGLYILRGLLEPDGVLLIETNAVDDFKRSFANFGRFYAGMWWQPSALCIKDMCHFMGFEDTEIGFYRPNRCLVRTVRSSADIPFTRGLNWRFDSLRDGRLRSMAPGMMAPVESHPGFWRQMKAIFKRKLIGLASGRHSE